MNMMALQYDIERCSPEQINYVMNYLNDNMGDGNMIVAIPNFCSLVKFDIESLKGLRNMIDKMIDAYEDI